MADRSFTLEEAQSLLPVLESLLRTAIDGKKLIETVDTELQELAHRVFLSGGLLVNIIQVARRKAEREKTIQRVKDTLAEIDATGVPVIAVAPIPDRGLGEAINDRLKRAAAPRSAD